MSDLAEMRKQLRELRKGVVKPVSRMRKGDVAAEIEKLRGMREETPASAAVPSAGKKVAKAAVESIKEAKSKEFPVKPSKGEKKAAPEAPKKKKISKADMLKMISEMSSSDEE